jgi:glyoxylase-like metal-dependent hydrolase (beta-lactamase superfamily II)
VIRNSARTILVDTGFDEAEAKKRNRRVLRAPAAALELIGISAGQIDQLVVTHLHYDHAGTLGAFPKAHFHLQAAEMQYATGPCMCHAALRVPFTAEHVCEMVRNVFSGRVVFHEGTPRSRRASPCTRSAATAAACNACAWRRHRGRSCSPPTASHYYENFEQAKSSQSSSM